MAKKVIQVPIDEELLNALDRWSQKEGKPRADVIRQACRRYLAQAQSEELDRLYEQGYKRLPEGPELGQAQVALAAEILSEELW